LFIYSSRDCDGDGQPDPFCQMRTSVEGEKTCGCMQSSNSCTDSWSEACPDLDEILPSNHLIEVRPGEVSVQADVSGTLMYKYVHIGDSVGYGDKIAAIIVGDEIHTVSSKTSGVVTKVLDVFTGQEVKSGTRIAVIEVNSVYNAAGFYKWLILLFLLCCAIFFLVLCCRSKEEPKPEPAPPPAPAERAVAPEPVVQETKPAPEPAPKQKPVESAPAPEPAPAPAPAPAPTPAPAPAPAPAPVAAAPAPKPKEFKGVPIYFDDKAYFFKYHPIGIKFHRHAPIKIDSFVFNSYGKTLGLKEGMQLTKIGDEDVHENHKYADVDHKLLDAIKDLPFWPLRLDFKNQAGAVKTFMFKEKPIGIVFTKHAPIKIESFRPYSLAQEMGVELHSAIVRMGDQDVTQDHSFQHVNDELHTGLAHLPDRPFRIDFKDPATGKVHTFQFKERPMGILFNRTAPIRVEKFKPHSLAEQMGVKLHWEIVRIGNDDVVEDHSFHHVDKLLLDGLHYLPERKS